MKPKLLGVYTLPRIDDSDIVEPNLYIYEDRVELELGRHFVPKGVSITNHGMELDGYIKLCRKKFDFRDLILMNETLNRIMGKQK